MAGHRRSPGDRPRSDSWIPRSSSPIFLSRNSDDEGWSGCLLTYPARIPTNRLNCGKKIGEEERGIQLSLRGLSPGDRPQIIHIFQRKCTFSCIKKAIYLQRPYGKQYSDPTFFFSTETEDNSYSIARHTTIQTIYCALRKTKSERALGAKTRLIYHGDRITIPERVRVGK